MNRTAIIGNGIGGAYLYRMLRERRPDIEVDIYTTPVSSKCKTRACGWIVNYSRLKELGASLNFDFEPFITGRFGQIEIDGVRMPADNVVIDKPAVLKKLPGDASPIYNTPDISAYERIIDATGRRIYLPPRPDNEYVKIHQVRLIDNSRSYPSIGVHWDKSDKDMLYMIPVGDGTLHIGYSSIASPENSRNELKKYIKDKEVLCSCVSTLWFGGPTFPVVNGKFIAIGESAGLVDPLSGMGITPAMDSARALVEFWDNPAGYQRYIERKYSFMSRLKKARDGEPSPLMLLDILLSLRSEYALLGFRPGIRMAYNKLSRPRKK